jgi:hypothetical protein
MTNVFSRTSPSAFIIAGTPAQIKAALAQCMQQYGRDMPLSYILSLNTNHTSLKKRKEPSPVIDKSGDSSSVCIL